MELRQIEYVLAVVDRGSFTKAAAAVHVSQPSLSDGIRRLEAELGVRLFDRLGRSVELTDAGLALVGPARQLLGMLDADLVRGLAILDQKIDSLDSYLSAATPSAPRPAAAATPEGKKEEA